MKVLIIVFVVLSLLGSAMWMMPTQRERFQAKLRLKARGEGFQIQLVRLTAPRGKGEMEGNSHNVPAYRITRSNIDKKKAELLKPWQIFKVDAMANEGLPEKWSWKMGERTLNSDQLATLNQVIDILPADVIALESTPVQVTAYWKEGNESDLLIIRQALNQLIEGKL